MRKPLFLQLQNKLLTRELSFVASELPCGATLPNDSEISEWKTGECKSNSDHNPPWSLLIAASGLSEQLVLFALTSDAPVKGSDRGIYKVTGCFVGFEEEPAWTWDNVGQFRWHYVFFFFAFENSKQEWSVMQASDRDSSSCDQIFFLIDWYQYRMSLYSPI